MEDRNAHPRVPLVFDETPLVALARISEEFGIDLAIKRDDLAGLSLGGNKFRQLEYYLGAARAAGADTILITGAVQSNFTRSAVAAAASLGMRTVVQLEDRVPGMGEEYRTSGNVLLSRVLGAEIVTYPDGEDEAGADAALRARARQLREEGRHPYVIPLSPGNPPTGALGYIRAAREILSQGGDFDHIVVASGSGLTHAGLLAGMRGAGSGAKITGSCVRRPATEQAARIGQVVDGLTKLSKDALAIGPADIHVWDGALAPGYGRPGAAALAAMKLMAEREGILLDPVYTAKVFAAIPALVESGAIERGSRVLFVHTGGLAALFGYEPELDAAF